MQLQSILLWSALINYVALLLSAYKPAIWMFLIGPGLGAWLVRQVG